MRSNTALHMPMDVNLRRGVFLLLVPGLMVFPGGAALAQRQSPQQREQQEQPPAASSDQQVVARVNGRAITLEQLQRPLLEGYGLTMLLHLVQLELARQAASNAGIAVSPADVERERELTLIKLFPDAEKQDHPALFEQFLEQQRISRAEFDILLQTNANLRRVVEPQVRGKVTEENLKVAFNQTYGETVRVRHIQLANMSEVAEARRSLGQGQSFEEVARTMSRNPRTGPLGGELPPFSRAASSYPQAFRDAAFTLRVGEVSDPVQADGFFHLIKLESRIEPKAVQFENVRESLQADLEDRLIQQGMNQLRGQFGQEALKTLRIEDPVLREQYERRRAESTTSGGGVPQVSEEVDVRQELQRRLQRIQEQQRQPSSTQPAGEDARP